MYYFSILVSIGLLAMAAYACNIRAEVLMDIAKPVFINMVLYNGTETP